MLIGHSVSDADGRILALDAAVYDLLDRPRREIIGMSYLDLTHAADRRRNASAIGMLSSEGMPMAIRKRYLLPDGTTVETDLTVSRLSVGADGGRLIGTLYRVADADRRYTPRKLWQAARRLTQLNELRRDLLGSDLFTDHPLALLLQLYIDEAEGRGSDLRTLAAMVGLGLDSARRWLHALHQKELIEFIDGRFAQLSSTGAQHVARLLSASTG